MTRKQIELAQALVDALEDRPDDADGERLEWRLREIVEPFVEAAAAGRPPGAPPKVWRDWPRILADEPITRWLTQAELADMARVEPRSIQRYQRKGLPSWGDGRTRRYPYPHAIHWCLGYAALRRRGYTVDRLPLEIASAELGMANAQIYADTLRIRRGGHPRETS